jgi:hypothetical protein
MLSHDQLGKAAKSNRQLTRQHPRSKKNRKSKPKHLDRIFSFSAPTVLDMKNLLMSALVVPSSTRLE